MRNPVSSYHHPESFTAFYQQYKQKVYADALRITQSVYLAEEILQEVFVNCWIQRKRLNEVKDMVAWLFILTRNRAINHLQKEKREQIGLQDYYQHYRQLWPPTDDPVQEREYYQLVQQAIQALPLRRQQVYTLGKEWQLKRNDIAARLNMSELTVKTHMGKAIKDIKLFMQRRLGEDCSVL